MLVSRKERWEPALLIGVAVPVAALAVLAGQFDLVSGKRSELLYDKTYVQAQPWGPVDRLEGGWESTSRGLTIVPGKSGILTIVVPNDAGEQLIALLFGHVDPGGKLTMSVSTDGRRFRTVSQETVLDGARIDLSRGLGTGERVWVRIESSPSTAAIELKRIRLVRLKRPLTFPNLPIAGLLILTPVLAYVVRARTQRPGALACGLVVLCGLSVLTDVLASVAGSAEHKQWWELVVISQARDKYYLIPYAVLLLLMGWQTKVWNPSAPDVRAWGGFALAGLLAWGGSNRLAAFSEIGGSQLGPDAMTYMHLAGSLQGAYDTMYREPLWIWMIKAWFTVTGPSAAHQRLLTCLLSLIVIWATYRLFTDYTGHPLIGSLAAAAVAGNTFLIRLSAQGLREEAYVLAVLAVVYLVFVKSNGLSPPRQALWLGVAGAAAHLLRFNSYLFCIPFLALWAWRQGRTRWWLVLLPVTLIVAVSVPHVQHNQRQFGDPLYSVNVHFVWSRNYEFVLLKQTGCPGCPTREEVEANSTAGPTLDARQYLFGLHNLEEVVSRTLQGYRDLYMRPGDLFAIQSGTASPWGFGAYLIGLVLVLMGPYREMVGVILLLANGVPFALTLGIDPRIAIQTAPFVAFIAAYGLTRSIDAVGKVFEHGSSREPLVHPASRQNVPSPHPLPPVGGEDKVRGGADLIKSWSRL